MEKNKQDKYGQTTNSTNMDKQQTVQIKTISKQYKYRKQQTLQQQHTKLVYGTAADS